MTGMPPPVPFFSLRRHTSDVTALHFICAEENVHLSNTLEPSLLSGSRTGEIFLWNLKNFRVSDELFGHDGKTIMWLNSYADNLISQGKDGFICLWHRCDEKWVVLRKVPSSEIGFCSAAILKEPLQVWLAVPLADTGIVRFYDFRSNTLVSETEQLNHGMCMCLKMIEYKSDCVAVFCGYEDGTIVVWDCNNNCVISSLKCHNEPVFCLDVDLLHRQRGISGSAESTIQVWAISEKLALTQEKPIVIKNSGVNVVSIRYDKQIVITGGWDGRIRVFSWKTLRPLAVLDFHEHAAVLCLQFSSENIGKEKSVLATGSKDSNVALWSLY